MRKGLQLGIVLSEKQKQIEDSLDNIHKGLSEITKEYSTIQTMFSSLVTFLCYRCLSVIFGS